MTPPASTAATAQTAIPPSPPPLDVTPEQLRKAYESNELSADEKYRGKTLRVTGLVVAVRKDFGDQPYVELLTRNEFLSVIARFDTLDDELRWLKRGDKVLVRCMGDGMLVVPRLRACAIETHWVRKRE